MNAAEKVARESYGKLVAFLAARTRDVAGAEDALSEAVTSRDTEYGVGTALFCYIYDSALC